MNRFEQARALILRAIEARVFPAAVAEVGSSAGSIWSHAAGSLTLDRPDASVRQDTVFDLASLTKVVATTTLAMELTRTGAISLAQPLAEIFPEWLGDERAGATVRDLLEHAAGLPARLVDAPPTGRREFEHDICSTLLEYAPRSRSIYSDLGFILLGFHLADRCGAPLDRLFAEVAGRVVTISSETLTYGPVPSAAPTEPLPDDLRRGRTLNGEVHDNYAAALGGVAGHAGLFGTAAALGIFARTMLRAVRGEEGLPPPFGPELAVRFTTSRSAVPGSSRALGWDTMLPTSSCGTRMSSAAFGHVGFTGTSLWIDPVRDRYFVLLTNRAGGGGTLDAMRTVRRAFHDALGEV
jgi:CubicO group peptidase (beta-lactamase class C family)